MKNARYKMIKSKPIRHTIVQVVEEKPKIQVLNKRRVSFGYNFHLFDFLLIMLSIYMLYKFNFHTVYILFTGIITFFSCFHKK